MSLRLCIYGLHGAIQMLLLLLLLLGVHPNECVKEKYPLSNFTNNMQQLGNGAI